MRWRSPTTLLILLAVALLAGALTLRLRGRSSEPEPPVANVPAAPESAAAGSAEPAPE